uniref:FUSC family protein n=1 Tax=Geminicoccus flavidas TaxID=2506407 RepID=UPI00135C9271
APALPAALGDLLLGLRSLDPRLAQALDRQAGAEALLIGDPNADARSFRPKAVYLAPHREWRVAIMTGIVPGLAVLLGGAVGWWSGWPVAELAVLGMCIFSMVLGAMPLPQVIAPRMLGGVLGGVVMAILYRLAVQPFVASPLELILSVAPFMALGGLVRASRRTAIPGIDFNMCFLLTSQAVLPTPTAPLGRILEEVAALVLSALVVTTGFRLLPRRPDRQAMAVVEAIRGDLALLVAGQRPSAPPGSVGPARILRLMLHLGRAASLGARAPGGLLAVLNLGHAIVGLHRELARPDLDDATRRTLDEALAALQDLAIAPDEVAVLLEQHAAHVPEPQARGMLLETAGALRDGKELLRFGLAGR